MTKLDELDGYALALRHEVALATSGGISGVTTPQEPALTPDVMSADFANRTDHLIDSVTGLRTVVAGLESRLKDAEFVARTAERLATTITRSTKRWRILVVFCAVFTCSVAILAYGNRVNAHKLTVLVDQAHAQQVQVNAELHEGAVIRTQALCALYDGILSGVSPTARAQYPKGPDAYDRRTASWAAQQATLHCPA